MKKIYCKNLFLTHSRAFITVALRFYYHQWHVSLDCDVYIFYQKLVNDAKPSNCDLSDEFKSV